MIPTLSLLPVNKSSNLSESSLAQSAQKAVFRTSNGNMGNNRLIVLIPPQITDEAEISKYILNLAQTRNADVFLVMLVSSYEDEAIGYLRISTITAFLLGFHFNVESKILWGRSWYKAIRQFVHLGDMVVCPKEVNTPRGIFFRESLSDQLIRNLTAPVQTFSGFTYHTQSSPWDIARKFVFWLGIISILVGFFWIDSSIDLSITGWVSNIVLIILVIVEVVAIYFWNSILG